MLPITNVQLYLFLTTMMPENRVDYDVLKTGDRIGIAHVRSPRVPFVKNHPLFRL